MERSLSRDLMVVNEGIEPPPIHQEATKLFTCHQCRHPKGRVAFCMGKRLNKACPLKYCEDCLRRRYEQKVAEIALRTNWRCPKCLGNCNCSHCLIRRGKTPTGKVDKDILVALFNVTQLPEIEETTVEPGHESSIGEQNIHSTAENENSPNRINIYDSVNEKEFANKENTPREDLKEKTIACTSANAKSSMKMKDECETNKFKLPEGSNSISVYGIELPPEVVGDVFQFMKFCSTFENALNLRKGQSESVVREILIGRSSRRPQHSTLTQLLIHLLTVILEDKGKSSISMTTTDESWFTVLGECYKESGLKFEYIPAEMFEKGIDEYENLDSSTRLKLLNFLCDETLNTTVMRNIIDDYALESVEKKKEVKRKLRAAKEKEKQLKLRLKNELAKAKNEKGMSLSFLERYAIELPIDAERKEVHSEIQSAILMKESQNIEEALTRINPIGKGDNGQLLWKLKLDNEDENIFLQDLGIWNGVYPTNENWFTFNPDQKLEIEKNLSSIRKKPRKAKNNKNYVMESQ